MDGDGDGDGDGGGDGGGDGDGAGDGGEDEDGEFWASRLPPRGGRRGRRRRRAEEGTSPRVADKKVSSADPSLEPLLAALEFKLHRVLFLRILSPELEAGALGVEAGGPLAPPGVAAAGGGGDTEMAEASTRKEGGIATGGADDAVGGGHASRTAEALRYMRQHMQGFAGTHAKHLQQLMGVLVFAGTPGLRSPYADAWAADASTEALAALGHEFVRLSCRMAGYASQSPLAVCVAAGTLALPKLAKLATNLQKMKKQSWTACEQLPVEIDLGPEFIYRSIFACPVSKEQSTPENPPMLLPCGHVLCRESVLKIAKGTSRNFKCPYCPHDTHPAQCRPITF